MSVQSDSPIDCELVMRDGLTCADLARPKPNLDPIEAAQLTIALHPADLVATQNKEFAQALLAQGCSLRRNALAMTLNVQDHPTKSASDMSGDYSLIFIEDLSADALFDSWFSAYPAGHPDFHPGTRAELIAENLKPLLDRSMMGANHRSSQAVLNGSRAIAGIIISLREGRAPYGGPWGSELWVAPAHQHMGIGKSLISTAITQLREDGFTSLGLAVTKGNPAQLLYESIGFQLVEESWTLTLPKSN